MIDRTTSTENWRRVDARARCPVCDGSSWCTVSPDGSAARCKRRESDHPSPGDDGPAWIHVLDGADHRHRENGHVQPRQPKPGPDWRAMADRFAQAVTDEQTQALAAQLHVDPIALRELGLGWNGEQFTFPLYGSDGAVCGIKTRAADWSNPGCMRGSRLGLFRRVEPDDGMLFVCEGESDTAAALTLGFAAIGMPGAGQCATIAAAYARGRDVCIVADRDEAGTKGAAVLRKALDETALSVRGIVPPAKDLRDWLRAGCRPEDVKRLIEPKRPVRRGWRELLSLPAADWLIDTIVPAKGITLLAAEPSCGKTLFALDAALRMGHGMRWFGRVCKPGSTLFCEGEGMHGLAGRIRGWLAAHQDERETEGTFVDIVPVPMLTSAVGVAELETEIAAKLPGLVVIDTFALASAGADENDAGQIGAVLAEIIRLRDRYGVAFLLLHHLGKDATRSLQHRVRGSSALVAAADAVLHLERDDQAGLVLTVSKQRDGAMAAPMRLQIQVGAEGPWLALAAPDVRPPEMTPAEAAMAAGRQIAADVDRVVEALRRQGKASSIDQIAKLAGMNLQRGRIAVHQAMDVQPPRIIRTGNTKQAVFTASETGGSRDPHTPRRTSDVHGAASVLPEIDVPDVDGRRSDVVDVDGPASPRCRDLGSKETTA